jgi:hypothetical protein
MTKAGDCVNAGSIGVFFSIACMHRAHLRQLCNLLGMTALHAP